MQSEAAIHRSAADTVTRACKLAVQALQADRSECAPDDYAGHAKLFLRCRYYIVTSFRDLLFRSLSDASDHNTFEAAWRYAWYQEISFWRGLTGDHSEPHPAAEYLRTTCLHGLSFYKTIAHQAQCRYGPVHTLAETILDGAAAQRAEAEMKAAVEDLPPPEVADCSGFLQSCLMKMGDLARYVAQVSSNVTAPEVRDAWNVTVSYYLKARALDPLNGKLHNQLAVVEELQAGDGLHVCMGACMRFALAACAVKPLISGEKNWMRCVGNHRDAVSERLPPSRLASLAPSSMCARTLVCRKFTHQVQTATMLLVVTFGTSVDCLDLDKCDSRWEACVPLLQSIFDHSSYAKAARFRPYHRDFGIEAALFACLCVWRSLCDMKNCACQVEAVRQSAVYSYACKLLLRMTAAWIEFTVRALSRAREANATASRPYPALTAADRLLAGLRLLVASCSRTVDKNALVLAFDDLSVLPEALALMPAAISPAFLRRDSVQPSALPEAQLVRGCKMFAAWEPPHADSSEPVVLVIHRGPADAAVPATEGIKDQDASVFGISAVRVQALARECKALAELAGSVTWHAGTAACAPTLMKAADEFAGAGQDECDGAPCVAEQDGAGRAQDGTGTTQQPAATVLQAGLSSKSTQQHAVSAEGADPFGGSLARSQLAVAGSPSGSNDNLDEVLLEPGQGWGGATSHAGRLHIDSVFSNRWHDEVEPEPSAGVERDVMSTPDCVRLPREHESLAAELHLPNSLHLGRVGRRHGPWRLDSSRSGGGGLDEPVLEHLSIADAVGLPRSLQLESSMAVEAEADVAASAAELRGSRAPRFGRLDDQPSLEPERHYRSAGADEGDQAACGNALEVVDSAALDSESSDAAADPYTKELHEREELHIDNRSWWSGNDMQDGIE